VERHVLEVGKRLVKNGYKVIVITEKYQSNGESDNSMGEVGGIEIRRIDAGGDNYFKKFRIWRQLFKLRQIIKAADIVHCHDVFFWYLPFRFLYPQKKVYTTFHGYETKFPPSKKAILIRKISEKLSWGNICVGDYIRKWYGTKPTYTTYGGIGILPINTNTTNKYQSKNNRLKIVFIGRLEVDTGVLIYLKVLDILKNKKIEFEFEVCGDGSLRGEVERYGRVYGFIKNLDPYISKADIVFSSSYLSILQSMLNKRLTIAAYDNPIKEDYLKMAPFAKWIVIDNSSHKIADKILWFMERQEEKEKMINKGYEWVKTKTWEKVLEIYTDLWGC
jgi:glycosyltransferase involved in cell wall biosynthesis